MTKTGKHHFYLSYTIEGNGTTVRYIIKFTTSDADKYIERMRKRYEKKGIKFMPGKPLDVDI